MSPGLSIPSGCSKILRRCSGFMIFLLSVFLTMPDAAFWSWITASAPGLAEAAKPFIPILGLPPEMGYALRRRWKIRHEERSAGGFEGRFQGTFKLIALHNRSPGIPRISAGQGITAGRTKAMVFSFLRDRSGDLYLSCRGWRVHHIDLLSTGLSITKRYSKLPANGLDPGEGRISSLD